jgi:anti-anti-sigma factor
MNGAVLFLDAAVSGPDLADIARPPSMPAPLRLAADEIRGVPALLLSGDLAFGQSMRVLHDAVTDLGDQGHKCLVLDLTNVESADSTGIGALLDVVRVLGEGVGRVFLLRPSARLRNSLNLIRVTSMFEVVNDETDLVRRLEATGGTGPA